MNPFPLVPSGAVRVALVTVAVLLGTSAAFAAEGKFERTLTVNGPVMLTVGTGAGDIHMLPGNDGSVIIHARVRGHGWSGAEDRVKQVVDNPPIEQSGNLIRIGKAGESHWGRDVSIDYDITAPPQTSVKVSTGSGDLELKGFAGDYKADSGSGDLVIDQMRGSGNVSTGSGKIHISDAQGGLRAHTGSGDVSVSGNVTQVWHLGTGSGEVEVSTASGSKFDVDASSGSGDIKCDQPITMQGSIDRQHVRGRVNGGGPTLYVETGSGDIHIR